MVPRKHPASTHYALIQSRNVVCCISRELAPLRRTPAEQSGWRLDTQRVGGHGFVSRLLDGAGVFTGTTWRSHEDKETKVASQRRRHRLMAIVLMRGGAG
jgi:hypothetical protein